MLCEDISEAEVQEALGKAHEVSSAGPCGQTITLFQTSFSRITGYFQSSNQLTSFQQRTSLCVTFDVLREVSH
jgi:hypothetical protein